jgi:LPXTG-motif cell wall-anchored protein
MKEKVSEENKKIYLIAGAVAVLGAVIIIIKTRKK